MPTLLYLSESDVATAFTPHVAHASQRAAFEAMGRGDAVLPPRLLVPGKGDDVAFCYAARAGRQASAVSKFGSVHAGNVAEGLPAVHALVTVLDPTTGAPACVMAGTTLTTVRTAAASAVAVEALWAGARPEASDAALDLAIIGSGVQAEAHAHAICAALADGPGVARIRLAARTRESADTLAARWRDERPAGAPEIEVAESAQEACEDADVIALCTTSTTPVIEAGWVKDGALVVSVGSFSAERSEVPADLMRETRVVVDDRETALADNGCVVAAIDAGVLDASRVQTLGEVLLADDAATAYATPSRAGAQDGDDTRTDEPRVTVYASVGVGVQDAAAATAVFEAALAGGVGTHLPL